MNGDRPEPPHPEDLQERIRKLAYAMWEAGGHQHGRALEYWLDAERRLLSMRDEGKEGAKTGPDEEPPRPETKDG